MTFRIRYLLCINSVNRNHCNIPNIPLYFTEAPKVSFTVKLFSVILHKKNLFLLSIVPCCFAIGQIFNLSITHLLKFYSKIPKTKNFIYEPRSLFYKPCISLFQIHEFISIFDFL